MFHLGISYGHNATVAVVEDGALVFCQSEERIDRQKNSTGFPIETLRLVYRTICPPAAVASCTLFLGRNLGYVVLKQAGFRKMPMAHTIDRDAIATWETNRAAAEAAEDAYARTIVALARDPALTAEANLWFSAATGLPGDRIHHLDHHLAHGYSTLPFLDGDGPRLVFTLDGEGDGLCASVAVWRDGTLTRLSETPELLSLGKVYETVTGLLGFKMMEHEYKVMGLAPYAKPEYYQDLLARLATLMWVDEAGAWRSSVRSGKALLSELAALCRYQRFDAIAGALQEHTERQICAWITHWIRATGIRSIACAGGVFMNVKANQRVLGLDVVERMAVVPSCGDESTAIGCAVHGSCTHEPARPIRPVEHLYLGQSWDDREVEDLLGSMAGHFTIAEPPDLADAVAQLLADGEIVARCAGAMEFGARALGNRSILSHPARVENIQVINDAIKNRDFWMPFAPTVLDDAVPALVRGHEKLFSRFMMVSFDATAAGRRDLAAALHRADFTLRPQMLARAANPGYYAIIEAFRRRTGIGALLNTSFNLHGEPIVGSPLDALQTMANSGLRHLVINKFLLSKPGAA